MDYDLGLLFAVVLNPFSKIPPRSPTGGFFRTRLAAG